jgi:hypothetical protein
MLISVFVSLTEPTCAYRPFQPVYDLSQWIQNGFVPSLEVTVRHVGQNGVSLSACLTHTG